MPRFCPGPRPVLNGRPSIWPMASSGLASLSVHYNTFNGFVPFGEEAQDVPLESLGPLHTGNRSLAR